MRLPNILLILWVALGPFGPAPLSAQQLLRVGIDQNPPLVFLDGSGIAQGFSVDLLNYVASNEGWAIEYHLYSWDECLRRLEEGSIDLVIDIAYSDARALRFDFTRQTILINWGQFYAPRGQHVDTLRDLDGARVAVLKDDIYHTQARHLVGQLGIDTAFLELSSYADALDAVVDEQADAAVVSRFFGLQRERPASLVAQPLMVGPVELRFAATKDRHRKLLNQIDRQIYLMKLEKDSVYFTSYTKWLQSTYLEVFPRWLQLSLASLTTALLAGIFTILVMRAIIKKGARALSQSEFRYRDIVENINDIVFTLDAGGRITYVSPVVTEQSGYTSEELVGHQFDKFVHSDDLEIARDSFRRSLAGDPEGAEYRTITKEKEIRWVRSSARAIILNGVTAGLRGTISDITDQKRLEEQLQGAQRMESVARLTAGVAHDFNNLLTVIQGYAEMLRSMNLAPSIESSLEQISAAGHRAAALTNQLLAFGRKQVLVPEVLNPNSLITEVKKLLLRVIGEDVQLETTLESTVGSIEVDPVKFEQVIMNLAVNARDAMPDGGLLTITTSNVDIDSACAESHLPVTPGSYVQIAVSDTGTGMTADVMGHIFEPFYTTKGPGRGTGLGLSTAYGIVKQSGGHIWPYSEPGMGSTFKVYLPRVPEKETVQITHIERPTVPNGNETILLVEDDELVRRFIARAIRDHGYTIIEATGPSEALPLFAQNRDRIDLILTDIVMAGSSGTAMAMEIRKTAPDIRIVYMSGYADEVIAHHGIPDEGNSFLPKPFTAGALLVKLREALDPRD